MKEQSVGGERSIGANVALESAGAVVSRYGLVVILLLIGILKFTPAEADGIQPHVSPTARSCPGCISLSASRASPILSASLNF